VHLLALDDNTTKVLLGLIGIVPSAIAAYFAYLAHKNVKTPSGETIGKLVERTNQLAEANTALNLGIHDAVGAKSAASDVVAKIANGGGLAPEAQPNG
jgi:hypothetical protein